MKKIILSSLMLFVGALSYGQISDGDFELSTAEVIDRGSHATNWFAVTNNPKASTCLAANIPIKEDGRIEDDGTGNNMVAAFYDNNTNCKNNKVVGSSALLNKEITGLVTGITYKIKFDIMYAGAEAPDQHFNVQIRTNPSANGTKQSWITGGVAGDNASGDTSFGKIDKSAISTDFESKTITFKPTVTLGTKYYLTFISPTASFVSETSKILIDNVSISYDATWTGDTDTDWDKATNWDTGVVPTALSDVTIPSGTSNDPIISATTGAVAYDITTNNVLTINSGGSLIVGGTSTGNVTYNRNLSSTSGNLKGWHLVGSPVVGQVYNNAYATTNSIAISGAKRGIATYNNGLDTNNWSYLEVDDSNSGTFDTATGYSVKTTANADVSFTGAVNTEDVVKAITIGAGTPFNLISNPFTSYIDSATFLKDNSGNLTNETIWVWNPTDENYDTKVTSDSFQVAPGQGFFVSCGIAANVTFAETNQTHQGTDTFLRSGAKPEITLNITDGDLGRYAKIYFNNNATEGFDNGYDGETFTGVANAFDVFTQLVSNNVGKNYQIQSLPNTDLESMIVPVGVKAVAGKEITFTAAALNLPAGLKVFLEDRATGTFTRLDEANSNYKVTLTEALNGVGRFYLRATSSALSVDSVALNGVSIFKSNNSTLKIAGLTQGKAAISLFNILGKQVMSSSFEANGVKEILLPKLATGVYVVQLTTEAGKLSKKIILE